MHTIVAGDKIAIGKVEELVDPAMDFCLFNPLLLHPGGVWVPLIFIPRVYPPLAWLYLAADEAPDHTRPTILMRLGLSSNSRFFVLTTRPVWMFSTVGVENSNKVFLAIASDTGDELPS